MAYDKSTTIHHLTESGWVHSAIRPENAIETWMCKTHQASGWSKEDRYWSCEWVSPLFSRDDRDKTRLLFASKIGMVEGNNGNVRTTVESPI